MWKIGFLGLLAAVLIGANIFAWYYFVQSRAPIQAPTPSPLSPPVVTIVPTSSPAPPVGGDETNLIKQAIFKLTGLDETKAEVSINKNTGKHAKGNIKEFEAVGGAYWLAAKVGDTWIGVYAGQAHPECSEIAPYNFPKEMVLECLDNTGKVVPR